MDGNGRKHSGSGVRGDAAEVVESHEKEDER